METIKSVNYRLTIHNIIVKNVSNMKSFICGRQNFFFPMATDDPFLLMLFLLLYHPLLLCMDIVNKMHLRWWDISAGVMFHSLCQQSYQETDFSFLDLTKEAGMLWDFPVERATWKGSERILQQMASEKSWPQVWHIAKNQPCQKPLELERKFCPVWVPDRITLVVGT